MLKSYLALTTFLPASASLSMGTGERHCISRMLNELLQTLQHNRMPGTTGSAASPTRTTSRSCHSHQRAQLMRKKLNGTDLLGTKGGQALFLTACCTQLQAGCGVRLQINVTFLLTLHSHLKLILQHHRERFLPKLTAESTNTICFPASRV